MNEYYVKDLLKKKILTGKELEFFINEYKVYFKSTISFSMKIQSLSAYEVFKMGKGTNFFKKYPSVAFTVDDTNDKHKVLHLYLYDTPEDIFKWIKKFYKMKEFL